MTGFILAIQIRYAYNSYYMSKMSPANFGFGKEPWPSTQMGYLALVPLAGVLQLGINWGLRKAGWAGRHWEGAR